MRLDRLLCTSTKERYQPCPPVLGFSLCSALELTELTACCPRPMDSPGRALPRSLLPHSPSLQAIAFPLSPPTFPLRGKNTCTTQSPLLILYTFPTVCRSSVNVDRADV